MTAATAVSTPSAAYDRIAITLHWLIAIGVLAQIALGWWMIDIPKYPVGVRAAWFNLHKSIGMTLGPLILLRVAWRLTHRPARLPSSIPAWQARAARVSHFVLYACMVIMPLAGYLGSTFSGYPIKYFGWTVPGWGWKDESLKEFCSTVHLITASLFTTLIAIHIAAAIKHALDKDGVFARMLPRAAGASDRTRLSLGQGT